MDAPGYGQNWSSCTGSLMLTPSMWSGNLRGTSSLIFARLYTRLRSALRNDIH